MSGKCEQRSKVKLLKTELPGKACSTARTKCPNDIGNICSPVTAVSRNPTGRIVHLARTRDSFGTRSCGNRTTQVRHKKDERHSARVASGIVEFQIASSQVHRAILHDTCTEKFEGRKKKYGERARGTEGKFTCNEKERYEPVEKAEVQEWNFSGLFFRNLNESTEVVTSYIYIDTLCKYKIAPLFLNGIRIKLELFQAS